MKCRIHGAIFVEIALEHIFYWEFIRKEDAKKSTATNVLRKDQKRANKLKSHRQITDDEEHHAMACTRTKKVDVQNDQVRDTINNSLRFDRPTDRSTNQPTDRPLFLSLGLLSLSSFSVRLCFFSITVYKNVVPMGGYLC